jgi:hypothetical protein
MGPSRSVSSNAGEQVVELGPKPNDRSTAGSVGRHPTTLAEPTNHRYPTCDRAGEMGRFAAAESCRRCPGVGGPLIEVPVLVGPVYVALASCRLFPTSKQAAA